MQKLNLSLNFFSIFRQTRKNNKIATHNKAMNSKYIEFIPFIQLKFKIFLDN